MRTPYQQQIAEQTEIQRTIMRGNAHLCSGNFGKCWRALYPVKSAEELAARVGCCVRAASYELSGEREPSAKSIAVLINEILLRN